MRQIVSVKFRRTKCVNQMKISRLILVQLKKYALISIKVMSNNAWKNPTFIAIADFAQNEDMKRYAAV